MYYQIVIKNLKKRIDVQVAPSEVMVIGG